LQRRSSTITRQAVYERIGALGGWDLASSRTCSSHVDMNAPETIAVIPNNANLCALSFVVFNNAVWSENFQSKMLKTRIKSPIS
jgi:hypothetical protein